MVNDGASSSHVADAAVVRHTPIWDPGWGQQGRVAGAAIQVPRKIPIKLEPKAFFANERTFLSWANMAVAITATSGVMTSLSLNKGDLTSKGPIAPVTISLVSLMLVPVAMAMLYYAYWLYLHRNAFMKRKQVGRYDERIGPIVVTSLVAAILIGITVLAYVSYFSY